MPSVSEPGDHACIKRMIKITTKFEKKKMVKYHIYKHHHIYPINLTERKAPCEGAVNGENNCNEFKGAFVWDILE